MRRPRLSRGHAPFERLLSPPGPPGARWSVVSSPDPATMSSPALVDLLLSAAGRASTVDLSELASRCDSEYAGYVRQWPGEHYRLLAALVAALRPRRVVEVGTFLGHSALAMLAGSEDVEVLTYDVLPWSSFEGSALRAADFAPGRLEQRLGDLSEPAYLATQLDTLRQADLLFVDAPKDGRFEQAFVATALEQLRDRRRIVVFDDIRLLPMVELWRTLPFSRVDATSLGHWSGTGILETATK